MPTEHEEANQDIPHLPCPNQHLRYQSKRESYLIGTFGGCATWDLLCHRPCNSLPFRHLGLAGSGTSSKSKIGIMCCFCKGRSIVSPFFVEATRGRKQLRWEGLATKATFSVAIVLLHILVWYSVFVVYDYGTQSYVLQVPYKLFICGQHKSTSVGPSHVSNKENVTTTRLTQVLAKRQELHSLYSMQ
jgi:hypothetical protein